MGAEEDQAMLKEMCNAYAKANSKNKYTFNFGVQGEGEAADKVLNDVQSGPDVYSFSSDQINKLYAGGALARIGGDIETNIKDVNTQESVNAATVTIEGTNQLFAYPCTGDNCLFLYYDKSVYKNPEDLKSLDKVLSTAQSAGKKVHFRLNDDGWYLSTFLFENPELKYDVTYNDKMVEQKVAINFDNSSGLDVMKALRTYLYSDALVAQTDDSKIIAAFTSNGGKREAAAAVSGTWNASTIKKLLGDNMGVCKLPTVNISGVSPLVKVAGVDKVNGKIKITGTATDETNLLDVNGLVWNVNGSSAEGLCGSVDVAGTFTNWEFEIDTSKLTDNTTHTINVIVKDNTKRNIIAAGTAVATAALLFLTRGKIKNIPFIKNAGTWLKGFWTNKIKPFGAHVGDIAKKSACELWNGTGKHKKLNAYAGRLLLALAVLSSVVGATTTIVGAKSATKEQKTVDTNKEYMVN